MSEPNSETVIEITESGKNIDNIRDNMAKPNSDDISCDKIEKDKLLWCNNTESTPQTITKESNDTTLNAIDNMSFKNVTNEGMDKLKIQRDIESTAANTVGTDKVENIKNAYAKIVTMVTENVEGKTEESPSAVSEGLAQDINKLGISETFTQNNKKAYSSVVLNKQTDSLRNLMLYDSTDNESDDSDFEKDWQLHILNSTITIESSDDSESDSNESLESSDDQNEADRNVELMQNKKKIFYPKATENKNQNQKDQQSALYSLEELDKFNLPVLPDLTNLKIDYENEEFLHIGHVKAIVESLVTIEAIQGTPSYDLDTIFFVDDQTSKKPLGSVYDVIGPVVSPIYCIRMKNEEELQEKGVKLNMKVYSAPKSRYTQYVFVSELMKIKGSDASWLDDKELPQGVNDSSGDELDFDPQPPILKRKRDSLDRHQRFEKTMNRCNSLHTRVARLMDQHRVIRRGIPYGQSSIITNVDCVPDIIIPPFNPAIPPPNFMDLRGMAPPHNPAAPQEQPHQYQNPHQLRLQQQMWERQEPHQPRIHRLPHGSSGFVNRGPIFYPNHNWNHHPGPSSGQGQY